MRRRQIYQMQREAAQQALIDPPIVSWQDVPTAIIDPHACPKCHRTIGRGRAMHEKHCKGIA